jgi:hypothetical protein
MRSNNKGQMLPLKCILILLAFLTAAGCKKNMVTKEGLSEAKQAAAGNLQTMSADLITGANGHPFNTVAYKNSGGVSYQTQADMLKAMGMTYYRINITTDANGNATSEANLLDLIAKCQANNIKILAMVGDRCSYSAGATPAAQYTKAYTQMSGFATKYGQYFDYFELGNEWELFDSLLYRPSQPGYPANFRNGRDSTDYNLPRLRNAEQYVKGMEAGLKSVLPSKQSIINTAGFFPTYWMDRMFAAAPTVNICGWHLYAEMPSGYVGLGVTNIHQYLFNRYHRPIWYTETGYRFKTSLTQQQNEDASNDWRNTLTTQATADPNVKAILFYELLDEPELGSQFTEQNFGFVKFNNYPGHSNAAAYNTWLANPNRYQDWSYKRPGAELVGPDLIVTDVTWSPASPHTGNSVVFTATVKNIGVAATPAGVIVGVGFKVDGHSAGCNGSSSASLAPGASVTLTANACSPSAWTALVGTHTVVATVDDPSNARIRESNETNNTRSETITVTN